jgi:hypothetical protein
VFCKTWFTTPFSIENERMDERTIFVDEFQDAASKDCD